MPAKVTETKEALVKAESSENISQTVSRFGKLVVRFIIKAYGFLQVCLHEGKGFDRPFNLYAQIFCDSSLDNEIPFKTNNEIDLDYYGKGLNLATYNYMHGLGYEVNVKTWFKKNWFYYN